MDDPSHAKPDVGCHGNYQVRNHGDCPCFVVGVDWSPQVLRLVYWLVRKVTDPTEAARSVRAHPWVPPWAYPSGFILGHVPGHILGVI